MEALDRSQRISPPYDYYYPDTLDTYSESTDFSDVTVSGFPGNPQAHSEHNSGVQIPIHGHVESLVPLNTGGHPLQMITAE